MSATISELDRLLEKITQIKTLLDSSPEVLECLRLLRDAEGDTVAIPVRTDHLIEVSEAAKVLKVSPSLVYRLAKEGKIKVYQTPHSDRRKFWYKDVVGLAREREEVFI